MPGISGLGSSCSGNLCRLTLLSWSIALRRRMRPGTLAVWPSPSLVPGGPAPSEAAPGQRPERAAGPPSERAPAWPALKETGKMLLGNRSWGFNPLYVSSTVLKSWCDVLFIHSSAEAPGFQVAILCSVCLRENTSFAKVANEKGSMLENQTKWI